MFRKILFLLIYLFAWVVFFELARVYFLISTAAYASDVSASLKLQTLWYGLKMDLSMASYFTVPVCLFVLCSLFISPFRKKSIYLWYAGILLFIQLLIAISDVEIFKAWGARLDFTPLKYLSTPKEMWASISHLPLVLIFIGFIVIYILSFWLFKKIISRSIILLSDRSNLLIQAVIVLLFMGGLIIPIRGGFQLSPLNQSSVFFSDDQYTNNAAVNASWNFMFSVTQINQLNHNPYVYMEEEKAGSIVQSLYDNQSWNEKYLGIGDTIKPNVIFIIWESFTEKALGKVVEGKNVINYFPNLINDGIYFSNCYSSGDRTDKGITAILSSYPALPKGSIVNYPGKTARLYGLGNFFLENNYSTNFYYGGEPEFANIKSYLTAQKFQHFITRNNFDQSDMNSKWGAHDGVVMNRLLTDIRIAKQPFFTTWLTLSSHEPFETPVPSVFTGSDKETKFMNSLHYTDSIVFTFVNELKKLPSWKNTLIIISADHGHYLPITGKRADDYRIPVLWLGGILENKHRVFGHTVSQLDIAGSLINELGVGADKFPFSRNIFNSSSNHFAFFTYNDGIGFITDSSRLLFDNAGRKIVFKEGKTDPEKANLSKGLMQMVYDNFLGK